MLKVFFLTTLLLGTTQNHAMQTAVRMRGLTKAELLQIAQLSALEKQQMLMNALGVGNLHVFKQIYPLVATLYPEISELLFHMMTKSPWRPTLNLRIIKLIAQKADINYSEKLPPLEMAVASAHKTGQLEMVEVFLQCGADPEKQITLKAGEPAMSILETTSLLTHEPTVYPHAEKIVALMQKYIDKKKEEAKKIAADFTMWLQFISEG